MWAEPWLGCEEVEVTQDRGAVLQETQQRHQGSFSQERAQGGPGGGGGDTCVYTVGRKPHFLKEVHVDPRVKALRLPSAPLPSTLLDASAHLLTHDARCSLITSPPARGEGTPEGPDVCPVHEHLSSPGI